MKIHMKQLVMLAAVFLLAACGRKEDASGPAAPAPAKIPAAAPAAAARVAKIVFVDQEESCECTKKRIAASWAALTAALGDPPRLPVERIHLDTEEAKAEALEAMKPLIVPPGIYFLDEKEALVAMLEGEVTTAQIAAALGE